MQTPPASSHVRQLLTAVDRVELGIEARRTRHPEGSAAAELLRVEAVVHAVRRLRSLDLGALPHACIGTVADDAERLAQALEREEGSKDDLTFAAERFVHCVAHLAVTPGNGNAEQEDLLETAGDITMAESRKVLTGLADDYGADARSERNTTYLLYLLAVLLAIAGIGLALSGIASAEEDGSLDLSIFAAYGSVGLALIAAAAVALREASRHLVAAHEATRLQRQLAALDAYLLPMPPAMRDLVRGALVQRVFPGLVEHEEPWLTPVWPDSADLIRAIYADRGMVTDEPD
jgi:hypothetical protein